MKLKQTIGPDFYLHRYGVDVRLVRDTDVPFILSLRADKWLTRFIHPTDNDEEKQTLWLKDYYIREKEGKDYYFIYSRNGEDFGLNRIYNIENDSCTGGSWICKPGTPMELVVATNLLHRDIMFDILGLQVDNFDVRKNNLKVRKFHKLSGSVETGETELDILYSLTAERYREKKAFLLKLANLEE